MQVPSSKLWPALTLSDQTPDSAIWRFRISAELPWFEGHFPDHPVLPGVTQVHWAVELAQAHFAIEGEFKEMKNLKFKSPMLPDQHISLSLRYQPERGQINFEYADDSQALSSGIVVFSQTRSADRT